jgi:beta-lactamase superfamily II metal-dependent hydrolase
MRDKLLVRVYDVGFGDCIYVGIPDAGRTFHMLIDCGNLKGPTGILQKAVNNVRSLLRSTDGAEEGLDLLVVTHPHKDHISGFDPAWFQGLAVGQVWLSAFMKEDHPQAQKSRRLQALSMQMAEALMAEAHSLGLSATEQAMLNLNISNPRALDALRNTSGVASETIAPQAPRLYVSRDQFAGLDKAALQKAGLGLEQGSMCWRGFQDQNTVLRVLAPEWDIDGAYLGKTATKHFGLLEREAKAEAGNGSADSAGASVHPTNIGSSDFRRLCARLLYSNLAFIEMDDDLRNQTSVVLLLEWRGRRLLFTGDAEWQGKPFSKDKGNASWDIMLENDKTFGHLAEPLDFLKVGHHGSVNGTPFVKNGGANQPVMDRLLPAATRGGAQVVVSTDVKAKFGKDNPVPYAPLLVELGRRAANVRCYGGDIQEGQPQRTDLEEYDPQLPIGYIDVELAPGA